MAATQPHKQHAPIKVEVRTDRGSRKASFLRMSGKLPGVVYGLGKEPVIIALPATEVVTVLQCGSHIMEIARLRQDGVLTEDNLHELRYESFCSSPATELAGIASFLGVDADFDLDPFEPIRDMNGRVGQELDPAAVSRLSERMRPALELEGYSPSGVAT